LFVIAAVSAPRTRSITPSHVPAACTVLNSCSIGLCFVWQPRPFPVSVIYSSCPSVRDFAAGFLRIPPRNGHPYLWLTVPTAKSVMDFHHQVIAHAGRTKNDTRTTIAQQPFQLAA